MTKTLSIALTLMLSASAFAQTQVAAITPRPAAVAPAQGAMPSGEAQLIMVRSALLALNHANATSNYAVLSALGSTNFRNANPAGKLSDSFAAFRANRIDLAPLGIVQPQQTAAPTIIGGRLRLIGRFPTQPMAVDYDMTFEPDAGQWKLFAIAVNLNKPVTPGR